MLRRNHVEVYKHTHFYKKIDTSLSYRVQVYICLYYGTKAPSGPRPPHYIRFAITLRYTTVGRTLLDERSARRRDFHRTTHNIHKRQNSMPPGGIRTHNPSKRAAADPCLRPRDNWDRAVYSVTGSNIKTWVF